MKSEAGQKILPEDPHNRALVAHVCPPDWENPKPIGRYNLVVIGGGTAGLVTAVGAAGLGAKVALIEKHLLGGDCLNYGCVPSKALLRSARAAADVRLSPSYGIHVPGNAQVDFPKVMERLRRLRAKIGRHDSAHRLKSLGVDVFLGEARFTGSDTVEVAGETLRFRKAVIATGARPAAPPIDGLEETGYLTNETVFSLTDRPRRLAVIGGGPIGSELSQAFQRLGSRVTVFEAGEHLLGREDRDAAEILQRVFLREGIRLIFKAKLTRTFRSAEGKVIVYEEDGREQQLVVDEILVGVGRSPNVESLNLEAAGVEYDHESGVKVDDTLRTSNPRIFAAGDVCLPYKFTHTADAAARLVIQNALFLGRKKWSRLTVPWVTYTDPEIAHVGLSEQDALKKGIGFDTFLRPLGEVDRAIVDGEEEGFVKVLVKKGGDKILGATIVARHAGEMIGEIGVVMVNGLGLLAIGNTIHPYPTQAEAIRQAADLCNRKRLTPFIRKVFSCWMAFARQDPIALFSACRDAVRGFAAGR